MGALCEPNVVFPKERSASFVTPGPIWGALDHKLSKLGVGVKHRTNPDLCVNPGCADERKTFSGSSVWSMCGTRISRSFLEVSEMQDAQAADDNMATIEA